MSDITSINGSSTFVRAIHGDDFAGEVRLSVLAKNHHEGFNNSRLSDFEARIAELNASDDLFASVATQSETLSSGEKGSGDQVQQFSAFFGDIDFASEKTSAKRYPKDLATACAILDSFEHQPFAIVHSGGGLHAYFRLQTPQTCLDRSARTRMATASREFQKRLQEHFKANGSEIDYVGDLARIGRLPGTLNHKYGEPRRVKVIAYNPTAKISDETLQELFETGSAAPQPSARRKVYPPADHQKIGEQCAWYNHQTGKGAATSDEPNWYATASITCRCENGDAIFLKTSAPHPGFTEREAAAKFKHAQTSAGPRTCGSICSELGNERFCNSCPHVGQITSPVQLGWAYRPGKEGPVPLGYTRDGSYVVRDQGQNTIKVLAASQMLSLQSQLGLANSLFWKVQFPSEKSMYNTIAAGEALIEECKRLGFFDPDTVRGRGFWREGERVVANLDGNTPPDTQHIYLCFDNLVLPGGFSFDVEKLQRLLQRLPWKNPQDAVLMIGWLALAILCGALSWRPHAFVYGPANSGKTTLHNLAVQLLSPLVISADGQSTEAGVRQRLGPDALPIVMDEFETDHSPTRLQSMMRLARSASSAESPMLRGTPEGKALVFSIRTMFLFTAINVAGMGPQDATRVLVFELGRHESDSEAAAAITAETKELTGLGQNWVGYVAAHAENIFEGIDIFKEALGAMESRHKQNIASLLSGAFVTLKGRLPTAEEAAAWTVEYGDTIARHGQAHERDNSSEALTHLFDFPVDAGQAGRYPLGHWVGIALKEARSSERRNDVSDAHRILSSHGMQFQMPDGEPVGLLLQNGSPSLNRIFANTPWASGAWQRALKQVPDAYSLANPVRFKGGTGKHRVTGLPLSVVPEPIDRIGDHDDF